MEFVSINLAEGVISFTLDEYESTFGPDPGEAQSIAGCRLCDRGKPYDEGLKLNKIDSELALFSCARLRALSDTVSACQTRLDK